MINFSGRLRRASLAEAVFLAVIASACGAAGAGRGDREALASDDRLWVVAPHPDDELLMAGELLRAAVLSHRPHTVLVVTNGDLGCGRDGWARERETIAALAELGVREEDVHFLGYPDGWLDALGPVPFDAVPRTQPDGTCGTGDHTYAARGAGGVDLHTLRTGHAGAWTATELDDDLVWLLERERPTEIVTAHGIDTHPDHAMTYVHLRRALDRAEIPAPRVLRSIVHQGPCWPNGSGVEPCPDVTLTQGTAFPLLAPPLDAYVPPLRVPSTDEGATLRAAIAHYTTQLMVPPEDAARSWLSSFARVDEPFWPESIARGSRDPVIASLDGASGEIHVHDDAISLVVDRTGVSLRHEGAPLRQLPVPHGEAVDAPHHWAITERPDAGAIELRVFRDDVFWMLVVIPR